MNRLLAIGLLVVCLAGIAEAQPAAPGVLADPWANQVGWQARLPPNSKRIDGFTLDIHAEQTLLVGYHPIRLTAHSTSKFPGDRTIEVHFQPLDGNFNSGPIGRIRSLIVCTLEMPQGATSVSKDVYLPHYNYDPTYTVRVIERGRVLPGYELTLGAPQRMAPYSTLQNRIGVLLPREAFAQVQSLAWQRTPDPTALLQALGTRSRMPLSSGLQWGGGPQPGFSLQPGFTVQAAGGNLIGTGDVALNPGPQWDRNQQKMLAAFPRIACVLPEQQLWDNWLAYESLDILLLPLPMLQRLSETDPKKATAIRHFAAAGGTLWLYGAEDEAAVDKVFKTAEDVGRRREREIWQKEKLLLPTGTRLKPYAAGRLVCIADEYPFPGKVADWKSLLGANERASIATVRRGVDPAFGDARFWNWVLPNVARPPVYAFLTLLGIFTISVGPVAYRFSSKLNRVYLMLLAAPVMAVLTTVLMIGYGLLSDGLGYQARIREVTWVDSASGTGLRWARSTYFAGIRPSDGLQFDADTAVYPYPQQQSQRNRIPKDETTAGKIVLSDQHQQLAYGFLPSRQQRQFVTFTPRDQLGGMTMAALDDDNPTTRQIRNRFDFTLRSLFLRDLQGDYWFVDQVDAFQTANAVRMDRLESGKQLRKMYSDHALELPVGFPRPGRETRNNFDLVWQAANGLSQPYRSMHDGMVEHHLRALLQIGGELPMGEFVALGDVTPDVLAREGADVSDSVHFCIGTWQ
ncbi:hypothetical protein [Roseimaritima ulvae]|uniref:Uncharacterized protein n=1 Tax=Roseimaritima ulvae TaxID=980254 RepID=A0A5B9R4T3_9BACT|nr:hypothetical protein [Roseimaritima ulvae]QEG41491.1 hypothetical protein UC8_35140 [Roseimaritima ulvae]